MVELLPQIGRRNAALRHSRIFDDVSGSVEVHDPTVSFTAYFPARPSVRSGPSGRVALCHGPG